VSARTPTAAELGSVGDRLIVTREDGRRLEVFAAAPTAGPALILCHGTPGCGLISRTWSEACAEHGVRLVSYSRPGYGASTRLPERTVADCAADVAAVATAVGARRFYVLGHSGGGSHALACAALLPDRVLATAVIAAAAPWGTAGLDWLDGQVEENVEEFQAAREGGRRLAALLEDWREEMLAGGSGDGDADGSDDGSGDASMSAEEPAAEEPAPSPEAIPSAADRASVTPENAAFADARRRHALAPGIWGWYDDDRTEVVPWGCDPAAIAGPVAVWHGGQDQLVPPAHGRWLAAAIPRARAHLLEDEGHFSILESRLGDVVADLRELDRLRVR
jgi:pimeloyl-ACP methyl ester carboxylesterase